MIEAKKLAAILLGSYPTGRPNDPEVYISAVAAALSQYPIDVMRVACDPRQGLQSRVKWLPTIAEVTEECQRLHDYDLRRAQRERQIQEQLAERRALPPPRPQPPPRGRIVTWRDIEAMESEGRKVRVVGVFEDGRGAPYRG